MNWGTKLGIGMALFMSFIITLGVLMLRSESDDLVDSDYYEKGIGYEKDYVRKNQVINDQAEPEIIANGNLMISFKSPAAGHIKFIHPSDKTMDKILEINSGEDNFVELPLEKMSKGQWKLLLEWESNGKTYMYEKEIRLN